VIAILSAAGAPIATCEERKVELRPHEADVEYALLDSSQLQVGSRLVWVMPEIPKGIDDSEKGLYGPDFEQYA